MFRVILAKTRPPAMQVVHKYSIENLQASRQLAKDLYERYLKDENSFCLSLEGGLGAGKTFLIREILGCFGVAGEIPSPTYALVNEYEAKGRYFAHFDFYRLPEPQDFFARGFADIADDASVSCFLEWPEKIPAIAKESFTGKKYHLRIEFGSDNGTREVALLTD